MSERVAVTLAGIGGYGEVYLSVLADEALQRRCRLIAVADPSPQRCRRLGELEAAGVPIYQSLEAMLDAAPAELVLLASPIHEHCSQSCLALARGSHVLCEKPAAATVQDVDRMIAARDQAGRHVGIGYQWSFAPPIQMLKRDIQTGLFGQPKRLKSLCLWPRDASYYGRNDWAGHLRDGQGRWVLDSPANNAMAHDLHNMLYVLGDRPDRSAAPASVQAETYRANPIENFDTMAVRVHTAAGVELLFLGSHAIQESSDPVFSFEFTEAVVEYAGGPAPIVARGKRGPHKEYASPAGVSHALKIAACLDALAGGPDVPCGLEAARSHTICVNGIHESASEPAGFPPELLHQTGCGPQRLVHVDGLPDVLRRCYHRSALLSELGVPWARPGREVDVRNYRWFPGGTSTVSSQ